MPPIDLFSSASSGPRSSFPDRGGGSARSSARSRCKDTADTPRRHATSHRQRYQAVARTGPTAGKTDLVIWKSASADTFMLAAYTRSLSHWLPTAHGGPSVSQFLPGIPNPVCPPDEPRRHAPRPWTSRPDDDAHDPPHHEAHRPCPHPGMQTNNHTDPPHTGERVRPFARTIQRAERRTDHGRDHDAAPIAAGRQPPTTSDRS